MIKISTLLLFLSIGSARVQLRDSAHWSNWNYIDLFNKYMSGFNYFGSKQLKTDDYLTKLVQTFAETESAEAQ